MASKDVLLRRKSIELLVIEMDRADVVGADYVVLHTGSAAGEDESAARKRAMDALNRGFTVGEMEGRSPSGKYRGRKRVTSLRGLRTWLKL